MPSGRADTKGIDIDVPADDDEETAEDDGSSGEDGDGDTDEYDEGVEEVEAEEVHDDGPKSSKRRPAARASGARPEEEPSGRRLWAVVVALLIIVPVAGLVYFFYGPSGDIQAIDLNAVAYTDNTGISGMTIAAQVNTGKPSHLSGNADLTVSFNGTTTYTGTLGISDSEGSRKIPLSQFAVGNGDYNVKVRFQGKSSSTIFTESQIIEKINVTAYNMTRATNSTIEYGSAKMGITVIFLSSSSVGQMAIAGDRLDIEMTGGGGTSKFTESVANKMQLNVNYSVPGAGNYTIKVTYLNSKVKAGSQYSTITTNAIDSKTDMPYVLVFIPPKAEAGPDQTVQIKLVDGGGKVTLDGSNSIAYGGARITNWTWDYADGNIEDGKTVTYVYKKPGVYDVILMVMDNNDNIDTDHCTVTVN